MATHSSILALDRGAWQATVHGVAKSWTRQNTKKSKNKKQKNKKPQSILSSYSSAPYPAVSDLTSQPNVDTQRNVNTLLLCVQG